MRLDRFNSQFKLAPLPPVQPGEISVVDVPIYVSPWLQPGIAGVSNTVASLRTSRTPSLFVPSLPSDKVYLPVYTKDASKDGLKVGEENEEVEDNDPREVAVEVEGPTTADVSGGKPLGHGRSSCSRVR